MEVVFKVLGIWCLASLVVAVAWYVVRMFRGER